SALTPCTATATGVGNLNQSLTVNYTGNVNAGTASATASFLGDGNHNGSTGASSFVIGKAIPTITWTNRASITYGPPLSGTQLNASADVPGTFTYTPAPGTVLNAGANQTLSVTFTPTDTTNYTTQTASVTITVSKGDSTVTVDCTAGAPYSYTGSAQTPCTAVATGAGNLNAQLTPSYSNNVNAGTASATADFTGDANHTSSSNTAVFTIGKATASVTPAAASKTYGATDPALSGVLAGFIAADNVTATYTRTAGETVAGSPYTISATLSPASALGNYNITSNTALFTIGKATPMITWTTPAAITYGIALSETQLNANSDVPGTFTFMPAAGTALNAGANQTLSTTFTPTDTTDYTTQTASVTITVNQASSSIAFTSSQNPSMVGISVTFTATVSSPRGTPTGTVTFNNGNSSLGTAPLASGQTAFSASMLALGTHSITAVYSGDTNFLSSTSSALSQMVTPLTGATGPLRALASNPRYFTDGSGKAILLSGSHTWNDFQDMDQSSSPAAFDFNGYVNFLKVHGNNVTILWKKDLPTFCNWGAGGTWHVVQFPWQRTGSTNASDGLPAFDLANFDQSYFDRLRARVLQLQQNGIYAIVQLFDGLQLTDNRCAGDGYPFSAGNNVNNVDDGGGTGSMTMTAPNAITDFQDTYVKRVIDTLNDLPNVLWEVSEEAPINSGSWWQGHMIDLIHSYESTQSMQHPVGFPTLDINNGSQDSTLYNSKADWVAPKARISPTSSCGTLGTPLCKVDINDSDHSYFGMWKDNVQANRNYLWENFVNGNGVIFMDPYSVFWSTDNRNLCRNPVNGVCDAPDTRWDNLRDNTGKGIVSYANRMNLAAMSPHPELSSTGFALANPGVEYLVYEPGSPSTFTVSLVPATYIYEWFNPSSLTVASTGTITVSAPGNQPFTQPFSGDAVLYLVAIAAADTQPPSAPGSLTLNAVSATQLNLSWTASTDNVGVTGYLVERCQDAGCTNFAQVATPSASVTAYSDTGILSNTTYAYRIRATDAAANFSAYSNVASASTLAVVAIAPGTATLTLILTQQFSVSGSGLTWSVDGVAGGSAATGTITTTGLYTPTLGSVGAHTVTASSATPPQIGNATVYVTNYPGTYTRDIDKLRTGLNPSETVLTPNNVRVAQFGKLFS
ncbi:MAG: hypothetical protein DMG64_17800, partial [Acidobacteria bacterium]